MILHKLIKYRIVKLPGFLKKTLLVFILQLTFSLAAFAHPNNLLDTIKIDSVKKDTILLNKSMYIIPGKPVEVIKYPSTETSSSKSDNTAGIKKGGSVANTQSVTTLPVSDAGRTMGSLNVSPSGASTYTVPIAVPPGINGVTPQVALTYNSQSGNGLAGYGWNISGVSMITRIPATKFHDNTIGRVNADINDRFALDGQRLILKSGTYGGNDAEYQTESYSNLKIVSKNTSTVGPDYFIVYYPDGSYAYYGSSTDSKSPTDYAITYSENPQGLHISYTYLHDDNTLAISAIGYGSKGSTAAINTINFTYDNRQRKEQGYTGNNSLFRTKILNGINVIGNNIYYRNYLLTHNVIDGLNYERLTSIQEQSGDASKTFAPITFDYTTTNAVISSSAIVLTAAGIASSTSNVLTADFNGNGKMDFILYPNAKNQAWICFDARDKKLTDNVTIEINPGEFEDIFAATELSYDNKITKGQGFLLVKQPADSVITFEAYSAGSESAIVALNPPKQWTNVPKIHSYYSECINARKPSTKIPRIFLSGDFNGDGLTDVIAVSKPYVKILYESFDPLVDIHDNCVPTTEAVDISTVNFINLDRRLTSNFVNEAGVLVQSYVEGDKLLTADFNGDGKTDIIHIASGKIFVYGLSSSNNLDLLWQTNDSAITLSYPPQLGDFNGDGKTDVMFPTSTTWPNNSHFVFFMSNGNFFVKQEAILPLANTASNWDGTTLTQSTIVANDINGDGKTDLIVSTTYTKNNITTGRAVVSMYNNMGPLSATGAPVFTLSATSDQSNLHLVHSSIPLFFTNGDPNFSLEFGLISDNSITLFSHEKDLRKEAPITSVTQDGITHYIEYADLTSNSNFNKQTYPNIDIATAPGLKQVGKIRRHNDTNNSDLIQTFTYNGGVTNVEGLGFLGFSELVKSNWYQNDADVNRLYTTIVNDPQLRGATLRSFTGKYPFSILNANIKDKIAAIPDTVLNTHMSSSKTVTAANSITLSDGFSASGTDGTFIAHINDPVTGTNDGASINDYITRTDYTYNTQLLPNKIFINTPTSVATKDLLSGTNTLVTYAYDSYYNVTKESSNFSGTGTKISEISYDNNPANGYVGRPVSKKETVSNGGDTFTTEEQYTYTGFLPTQIKSKGNGTPFITENRQYDTYGNITSKTVVTGSGSRTSLMQYDATGRFVTKVTDVEGLETNVQYDAHTGNPLTKTDPYNRTTTYQYDNWGRLIQTTDYLGNNSDRSYQRSGTDIVITETNHEGASKSTRVDLSGKTTLVTSKDVLGQLISKAYQYDIYDRPISESEPYIGNATQWTQTEYDEYSRPKKITSFTGKVTSITYNGLATTVNDGTKSTTTTKNALGNIVSTQDPGGTINNTYFANGNLKSADFAGSTQTIEQDGWGHKTKLTDPSAGVYTYTYNEFGETTNETTPKGSTAYVYDTNGKIQSKHLTGDNTDMSYTYTYDGTTKLPTSLSLTNTDGNNTSYTYTYDGNKRLVSTVEDNLHAKFTKTLTYDSYDRVLTETSEAKNKSNNLIVSKTVLNNYANGQLKSIVDNSTGLTIWDVGALNARGQVTTALLGASLKETNTYDQYGLPQEFKADMVSGANPVERMKLTYAFDAQRVNLNSRGNTAFGWNETFTYDTQDRLTAFTDNNGSQSQSYDNRGRITNNTRLGNYNYTGNSYQQAGLTDLTPFASYHYQNQPLQEVSFNAFKQPVEIKETGKEKISFQYNGDEQRSHMYYGDTTVDKMARPFRRHYSEDGSMEITENIPGGKTSFVFYLGGDAYTAPAIWKHEQTATTTTANLYYLHRDHLGSILMITDINGDVKEKRQFDAWGNIVKLTDGAGNPLTAFLILDRGYTGHEHLLGVGLINMNGRLYDPLLHRFFSPDNYVQDPSNTQNFNRYGYVLNNPLKYTDRDGNWAIVDDIVACLVGGSVNLISNALQGNIHSFWGAVSYFGVGIASGEATLYGGPLAGAAVSGLGNSLISQVSAHGWSNVSAGQLLLSGAISAATSAVGGWLSDKIAPVISSLTSKIASPLISHALGGAISNSVSGFALGTGMSLLSGKSLGDALGDGGSGALSGAGLGFMTGAIEGYKYAKDNDLGVLSGRSSTVLEIAPGPSPSSIQIEGGRLGNADTRAQIDAIAADLESRGWTITGGGGRKPEEYLKPLDPGSRKGGSYVDITAKHPNYGTLRINTVDTYKTNQITTRELNNASRIRLQIKPGEHLLLIPKK